MEYDTKVITEISMNTINSQLTSTLNEKAFIITQLAEVSRLSSSFKNLEEKLVATEKRAEASENKAEVAEKISEAAENKAEAAENKAEAAEKIAEAVEKIAEAISNKLEDFIAFYKITHPDGHFPCNTRGLFNPAKNQPQIRRTI